MRITTFKNMKGVIHGKDPKRIKCDTEGVLIIGSTEVKILPDSESVLPLLFHGGTGSADATFTDVNGNVYTLEKVVVKSGRIAPLSDTDMEIMELRCRADMAEDECEDLRGEIEVLKNIFDTNSLNFLIN